jgi:TatD DNase family protein
MIDTHAHIDSEDYNDDYQEVFKSAFDGGVEAIIIPATDPEGFERVRELSALDDRIFCAYGVHPHDASKYDSAVEEGILRLSQEKKCRAIGEIGLDYYYDFSPKDVQKDVFRRQIEIAKKRDLPVIIHNRDSDEDLIEIISSEMEKSRFQAVMHCFSSTLDIAKQVIDMGMFLSFTGNVTFKKSALDPIIEFAPLDRIMLETDSPYMTPVPNRGKRNHPLNVKSVAEKIATIKQINIEEVISMTTQNAKNFFKLFLLVFMVSVSTISLFAQDEDKEETEQVEAPKYVRPLFGIGGFVGTNTVVETYYDVIDNGAKGEKDISYDGLITPGVMLTYSPFDFMFVSLSYSYSKNTQVTKNQVNVGPTIHNTFDLAGHFIANPGRTINVFGTLGVHLMNNTISKDMSNEKSSSDWGFTTGIGGIGNIKIGNYGLLNIIAEWSLLFPFQKSEGYYGVDAQKNPLIYKESKFFSIPKVGIVFYPNF